MAHLNERLVSVGPVKDKGDWLRLKKALSSHLQFWKSSPDPGTPTEESQGG